MRLSMASVVFLFGMTALSAQDVKLAWNANPESDIGGYIIHYGTESGDLTETIDVGNKTTTTLEGLPDGVTHYAAVQAYNTLGQFSEISAEISFVPHIKPPALVKNQSGAEQPVSGGSLDFGVVRVGAIGDTRSFTVTNTGTAALTGLRFDIDGAVAGNFLVNGIPVNPQFARNGSFEQDLDDWSHTGNVIFNSIGGATDGTQIAQFSASNKPNTGVLSQSFATMPGVTYRLAFDVGVYSFNTNPQKLRTTIRGQQTLLSNDFTRSGTGDGRTVWTARTLEFTADSTSTTITFADVSSSTSNVDLMLDHVRVNQSTPPASATGPQITTLAPGASATFTVTFKPTSGGTRETLLSLIADDVPVVLYEVKLGGMGSIHLESWLAQNGILDGPAGNPDKDPLNNLQEYAFGTNPKTANMGAVSAADGQLVARGTPSVRFLGSQGEGFQGLFARRKDHASVNLRYMPQFSADLIHWVDATGLPEAIGDDGEMEVVAITAPDTINGMPVRFFRVGVEQVRAPNFNEWLASSQANNGTYGNPDGDALNNLQEFAFGTDPRTPEGRSVAEVGGLIASRGSPAVRVTHSPAPQLQGMFGRRKEHTAAGLVYRPQFSADLQTWIDADAMPVILADDGEMEIVSVAAPPSINGQPARFFRVGVEYVGQAVPYDAWLSENQASGAAENPPPDMLLAYAFGIEAGTRTPMVEESNGVLLSRGFPVGRVVTTPAFSFQGLFCRRIGHAALGLTYRPQFSADLVTWEDAGGVPVVLTDDAEIEVVSVTAPATIDGLPARFFRVGVEHQP
jgi:hypothetical protein